MINSKSIQAVEAAGFSRGFCKPLYDSYCFSRVPGTVKELLTRQKARSLPADVHGHSSEEYDAVVLFLVDGFGWRFFEKYRDKYPLLKRFFEEGIASKITSQFPSTTANHVTCMSTGLSVGESGVYEWFYYEPKVDRMIAPLLFSFAGDKGDATLLKTGIAPEEFYPRRTFYQELQEVGVSSYVLQQESIAHSPYSRVMFQGAQQLPFTHFKEGLEQIVELCAKPTPHKSYFYLYVGDIDAMGHRHGVDSPQFEKAVEQCWSELEEFFWKKMRGLKQKIACIAIADHGMTSVDPRTTCFLNEELPSIKEYIKKNRQGDLLVPAGSCRDFFLHIREECLEEVQEKLQKYLGARAAVYLTRELIEQGFFGTGTLSQTFLDRVGNLVILPFEGESVWWRERHRFDQHFYGAHGGLTREEMETIFLFINL